MSDYDVAIVCLNGHIINNSSIDFPEHNANFCPKCGAKGITACSGCNSPIRGYLRGSMTIGGDPPDSYCYNCGLSYPWTEKALKAADELIDLSNLSEAEKTDFKLAIVDITKDTPSTRVSAEKFKRYSAKAGKSIAEGIKEITINIAAEAVKRALFPQ
jgi:hypothetical protein